MLEGLLQSHWLILFMVKYSTDIVVCRIKSSIADDICYATGLLLESARCIGFLDWVGWANPTVNEVVEATFFVIIYLIHLFKSTYSMTLDYDHDGVREILVSAESRRQSELLISSQIQWFQQLTRLLLWKQRKQGGLRSATLTRLGLTIAGLFGG